MYLLSQGFYLIILFGFIFIVSIIVFLVDIVFRSVLKLLYFCLPFIHLVVNIS